MADMPSGPEVPDVPTVTVVHKVKSKLGYTEIHSTAEGFGENEKVIPRAELPPWSLTSQAYYIKVGFFLELNSILV